MRVRGSHARVIAMAVLAAVSRVVAAGDAEAVDRPLPLMEPAIVEYRWTFVAPEWVVEPRNVDVRAVISSTWTKRIDYGTLEFPIEHRAVSYTHLRAHETPEHLVCRLLLEKKKKPIE